MSYAHERDMEVRPCPPFPRTRSLTLRKHAPHWRTGDRGVVHRASIWCAHVSARNLHRSCCAGGGEKFIKKKRRRAYHVGLVQALQDLELLPWVVLLQEAPRLGALDGGELLGEQPGAAQVQARRVAERGELQHVHRRVRGEARADGALASPLQPRHLVRVRQHQHLHRVLLHVVLLAVAAPAGVHHDRRKIKIKHDSFGRPCFKLWRNFLHSI
jgi:hypothetical protein